MKLIKVIFAILVVVLSGCTMLSQRSDFVAQLQLPKPNVSENWCEKNTVKNGSITYGSLGYVERNGENICVFEVINKNGEVDIYYVNNNSNIYLDKYSKGRLVFSGVYENNTFNLVKNFSGASPNKQPVAQACSTNSRSDQLNCGLPTSSINISR